MAEEEVLKHTGLLFGGVERENEDTDLEDHKSAIEAFKNSEVDLFIIVKQVGYNKNKAKIFYYTRGSEEPAVRKDIDQQGKTNILKDWMQLEELARNEQDVDTQSIPQNFIELLGIREILTNGPMGIRRVWIYCGIEYINRLWEWVHTGGDFWGDKFDIIRVPDKCEFTDDALEVDNESNLKCCNFAYLTGASTSSSKSEIKRYCKEIKPQSIKLNNDGMLSDLHTFDIIHVFTTVNDNKLEGSYITSIGNAIAKTRSFFDEILSNKKTKKKLLTHLTAPHFLFLNMCGCKGIKSEILLLASPTTWIDTCFNVSEEFASNFEKKFYKELCGNKTNVAEALKEARGGLQNNACRFAYVLNGNPCVIIKVGKKS
jgi:hypothetical protein